MGRYTIRLTDEAKAHLKRLYKSGRKIDIKKVERIFKELEEHPEIGVGQPESLKHGLSGFWSRRISQKDRLIYQIDQDSVIVIVVSAGGHYSDR